MRLAGQVTIPSHRARRAPGAGRPRRRDTSSCRARSAAGPDGRPRAGSPGARSGSMVTSQAVTKPSVSSALGLEQAGQGGQDAGRPASRRAPACARPPAGGRRAPPRPDRGPSRRRSPRGSRPSRGLDDVEEVTAEDGVVAARLVVRGALDGVGAQQRGRQQARARGGPARRRSAGPRAAAAAVRCGPLALDRVADGTVEQLGGDVVLDQVVLRAGGQGVQRRSGRAGRSGR